MKLGEVVVVVAKFIRLISAGEYEAAVAMCQRGGDASAFHEGLTSLYGDLVDNIGEMPADGWQHLFVLGPTDLNDQHVIVDAPVCDRSGENMDWFFKFFLVPGDGEEWQIDYVSASN